MKAPAVMAFAVKLLAPSTVIVLSGVVPPTAPTKVMFPFPEFRVRFCAPLTVLLKRIFPTPGVVLRVNGPASTRGLLKVMFWPLVRNVPEILSDPVPPSINGPVRSMIELGEMVSRPEWVMDSGPPFVVVTLLLMVKFVPVSTIPALVVVLIGPLNVVVPDPAVCVIDPAEIAFEVTLTALVIANDVRGVMPPTAPVNVMLPPVPGFNVSAEAPSNVPGKAIFAPAAVAPALVVSKVRVPVTTVGPPIVMVPPLVVILPFTLIAVEPV